MPNIIELPGRIEAIRTAEVRARTDGIVEARLYREGTDVAEGQPLFRIDQRDYRAQVQQAQAALARAEAARVNAASIVRRYQPLVSERAVSAQEFDAAQSTLRQADASVADARAALSRAQLQLSYTIVRAPIAGRVGRAQVTEGALVSATQATPLTQVDQLSPIYAGFTQSSAALSELIQQARSGGLALPDLSHITVRLTLEDGSEYGPTGQLDFAGQTVDPTTGNVSGSVPQVIKISNSLLPALPTTTINYQLNLPSQPQDDSYKVAVTGSELMRPGDVLPPIGSTPATLTGSVNLKNDTPATTSGPRPRTS